MKQVYHYNLDFQHIPEQLSQMAQDHAKTDVDLPSLARQFYISYKRPEGFCNVLDEELQHSAEHTENGTSSFSSTKHPFNGPGDPELTGNANGKCFFSNSKMGPQQCIVQSDPAPIHFCPSTEAGIVGKLVNNKSRETESIIAYSSSKTESGKASTASDLSDESSSSNFSTIMSKPHRARDGRWAAIGEAQSRDGLLGLENFRLLKKLGCGDVGSVYLSELKGSGSYFAMKVMDKPALANRKKLGRAETEREILQCLDHPFLPTLYVHFETDKFSCLVMDFCPGGDLHTLRQKQHGKCFLEHAARFYAAEVLLALEYLHMLGIIYRDLKPENVLVREDGHIMLSDFDLSLRCSVSPTIIKSSNSNLSLEAQKLSSCDQPSCFRPRLFSRMSKKGNSSKPKIDPFRPANPLPELVAEPTSARSMSFVGTHEYLAPEIIKGEGHGSAVDWWTFGVFLYELLFGRTPYKGAGHRSTLFNIVGQQLMFPESPSVSLAARDLIGVLLVKEPQHRLAYRRGATEIKRHPFFQSVNWALIRLANPPLVPKQTIDGVIATCAEGQSSACAAHGPDAKVSGFDDVF